MPTAVVPDNKRIVWGWDHSITVGALPVSMFANGHVFFTQRLYEVIVIPHEAGDHRQSDHRQSFSLEFSQDVNKLCFSWAVV